MPFFIFGIDLLYVPHPNLHHNTKELGNTKETKRVYFGFFALLFSQVLSSSFLLGTCFKSIDVKSFLNGSRDIKSKIKLYSMRLELQLQCIHCLFIICGKRCKIYLFIKIYVYDSPHPLGQSSLVLHLLLQNKEVNWVVSKLYKGLNKYLMHNNESTTSLIWCNIRLIEAAG